MSRFDDQMSKLAKHIADKAMKEATSFTESLEAFKQLTLYYGLLLKNKGKDETDDDTPTFANFSSRLEIAQESANGRPAKQVSSRRERAE